MNHYCEYDEGIAPQTDIFSKISGSAFTSYYGFSVHCGSRNLGVKVNKYWAEKAKGDKIPKEIQKEIAAEVKVRNIDKRMIKSEIDAALKEWREANIHPGLLSGEDLRGYLTDMVIACTYARWNHKIILDRAFDVYSKLTGGREIKRISTMHNYIDFSGSTPIIRKGSVSAKKDEIYLLPLNMRDGIAICQGKGNSDWLDSSSHGLGRKMSRGEAKNKIDMKDFESDMTGIYSTSIVPETLDEAPSAYKDKEGVLKNLEPTMDILITLQPKINIKATK